MLTNAKVKSLCEAGRYGDGRNGLGLSLLVKPSGAKSWTQRLTIAGARRDIGLGGFPRVSLADARKRARANAEAVAEGKDPRAPKRAPMPSMPTFREAARACHDINRPRWRNSKHAANWLATLENHAMPALGDMPVDRITRQDVIGVLEPIWTKTPETARRVRQRMRAVMRWVVAHGHREDNPAGEGIDGALPPMPANRTHFRALPYQEVPEALETVAASTAGVAAKACFEFLVLTATRSGEARGAHWDEIDVDARLWTIPAERMKGGVAHRVPLSEAAIAALEEAAPLRDESGLVFPSPVGGRQLSDMTLTKVLRSTGLADRATVHGFRSSFRDWAAERTSASWAAMELSLAHNVGSAVERAYSRSDLLEARRALLEAWGEYVAS